ncbi:GIN domain-containing protein [Mucilaginibacter sp.]|uniref:GIN domain-containing protein n=1 Tax=Mucilaginibacter sp. TaxID=1882438 RepID=UPI0035691A21
MKTTILTIFAIASLAMVNSNSAYANSNNNDKEVSTVLNNVGNINKIEIHGNVELYVSDGSADQVKVYNKYYSESALVQSRDGVLRISSYNNQKLVVWVTANDLRAISAYDNAEVKSFGNLSKIELEVNLHNNATANLNLDAYRANVTVNDNAKATLSGTVNDYCLKYASPANVNAKDFAAVNSTTTLISNPEYKGSELARL